jgi:two-component system, LytTR family, sensor kinase
MNKLFQNKIGFFLVQFLFIALVDFALGGITYFIFSMLGYMNTDYEIAYNSSNSIFLGNLAESVVITIWVNIFATFSKKIKNNYLKYSILTIYAYFLESIAWHILFYDFQDFWRSLFNTDFVGFAFRLNTVMAANLAFYLLQHEAKRTQKMRKQEIQLIEMQQLKTKAQLEALQAKINPHFLYNSLNSIASLIHENPEKAEEMVLLLAKFFRYSTNAQSQYYIRLVDEIEMVKTYLEVEKVRFEERLEYSIVFENEEVKNCLVPQFLIQPLVENAIKHGISKVTNKGNLIIKAETKNNHLIISIFDNGAPFPAQISSGYGLRSTEEKLYLLGGVDAKMEILGEKDGKTIKMTLDKRFENEF